MRMKSPELRASAVVKCGDKASSIGAFVAQWLAIDPARGVDGQRPPVLLIARSAASPVARALVAMGPELAAAGISVQVIFTSVASDATAQSWSAPGSAIPFARSVRLTRNPRLADAHEQLVLGDGMAWYGDCMRRDPEKRDAFERFHAACDETARMAAQSFQRIWALSAPVSGRAPVLASLDRLPVHGEQAVPVDAASAVVVGDVPALPVVSTRHGVSMSDCC